MENIVRMCAAFCFAAVAAAGIAYADTTPLVTAVTANPASINNDYSVAVAWTIGNGTGHDLMITCLPGVTVKGPSGAFPCNTRMSVSANASDQVGLTVTNVSGTPKMLQITVYPKGVGGADYDPGAMSTTLTVGTAPQPITNFSVSTSSVSSGTALVFTWTGVDAPGANLYFDCVPNVAFYSSTPTPGASALPCGTPAFSSDLPINGSQTVYITTPSLNPVGATARIFPSIVAGSYDSTHAQTVGITVIAAPVQITTPSVSSFVANPTNIFSGATSTFSWTVSNATSTKMEFDCGNFVSVATFVNATTSTPIPCNSVASSPALSGTGTTTILFSNTATYPQAVPVLIVPQGPDGTFWRNQASTIMVTVNSAGITPTPQAGATPAQQSVSASSSPVASGTSHPTITATLVRGSRGAQVSIVQAFLALNRAIYPEGSVTGYFGNATQLAIERFQMKYGLANKGVVGFGSVGPKTKAKMNVLITP